MDIKPIVGIPMERTVSDIAFLHFWEIARMTGVPLIQLPYGRGDVNRNRLARVLMQEPEYTHLVMLDLDHVHPLDILDRLLRWQVDDPSKLVVGGLNFKRAKPYDACAYVRSDKGTLHPIAKWEDGLAKVDAIGFGCVSFSREVFDIIPDPWFQTIYNREYDFPGDDMFFCEQCEKYGVDVWCDTTTTSPHIGVDLVGQETYLSYIATHPPKTMRINNGSTISKDSSS